VGDALAGSAARMAEWERSFKHAAREHARLLDADERGGKDSSVFTGAGAGADGSQADDPVAHAAGALHALASDVGAFESWALRSELAAHEAVEAMLDVFDTAMGELRAAKVANHETFFRAAEAAEGVFSEGLAKQGAFGETEEKGDGESTPPPLCVWGAPPAHRPAAAPLLSLQPHTHIPFPLPSPSPPPTRSRAECRRRCRGSPAP
jgi:hypothetical protein